MEENLCIKILIVTHKPCSFPCGSRYFPIQAGAELSNQNLEINKDNVGNNISNLNACYNTQTALYWAWKNLNCDWLGLVHYRRLFSLDFGRKAHPLTDEEISRVISKNKVIVAKKRNYFISSLKEHYERTHYDGKHQLDVLRLILFNDYPDYITAWDSVMKQTYGYMFNMFIAPKEYANRYCTWLFPLLDKLYKMIDTSSYSSFDKRYIGRLSELLLNVWIEHNKTPVMELPVYMPEGEKIINKVWRMLYAYITKKKYTESA